MQRIWLSVVVPCLLMQPLDAGANEPNDCPVVEGTSAVEAEIFERLCRIEKKLIEIEAGGSSSDRIELSSDKRRTATWSTTGAGWLDMQKGTCPDGYVWIGAQCWPVTAPEGVDTDPPGRGNPCEAGAPHQALCDQFRVLLEPFEPLCVGDRCESFRPGGQWNDLLGPRFLDGEAPGVDRLQ